MAMLARLSLLTLSALLLGAGFVFYHFGEVEPCRILAKDKAREAQENTLVRALDLDAEGYYRLETSQYSTGRCTRELASRWWQDLWQRRDG